MATIPIKKKRTGGLSGRTGYASGEIQFTGQGATPAGRKSSSGTQVTSITRDNKPVSATPEVDGVKVTRTASGLSGLTFPDGRTFQNLNTEQVQSLVNDWRNRPINPAEQQAQQQAIIQQENAATMQKMQELSNIEELPPNERTADIQKNIDLREQSSGLITSDEFYTNKNVPVGAKITEAISPIVPLNKIVGSLPGGKFKSGVLSLLSENPEMRRYLGDYNNQDNYDAIVVDLTIADRDIGIAISGASDPLYSKEAEQLYRNAQARKRRAIAQLKMIAQSDQRKYVDTVKDKITELEAYYTTENGYSGKTKDDLAFISALNKVNMESENFG